MRKLIFVATAFACSLWAVSLAVAAEVYPSRPITIVVPFPAGGPFDVLARILGDRMRVTLGQPLIVENIAGAGGSVGAGRVARAAADGYTLSIGGLNTHVINGAIYALPYDVLNDFEPISLISSLPLLIVAKEDAAMTSLEGLITWLKANPDKALAGTPGAGTPQHVAGIFFQNMTRTRFEFVSYRSSGAMMQDLLASRINLIFDMADNSLLQVRAGVIKAYAVTAKTRLAVAPDIPTTDEAGLPGFHVSVWRALWAPKGTPKTVINKLNAAVVDALADPAVRQRITKSGQRIPAQVQQTAAALGVLQKAEIEKWWPIISAHFSHCRWIGQGVSGF
jgi:tripartite-type tricarboxylate transporter receptor subunit TctC